MSVLTIDIYERNGLCVGVPRQLRIEFEGAMYHLVARGNRHEAIFRDDQDRQSFLCLLGDICVKASWKVHAYCLLDNHFHLVVETPIATLTSGMKWLLGVYTGRFNRRHQTTGHVFAGRYKSVVIDTQSGSYFQTACDYVHLNPARAKLLKPLEPLSSFQWASVRDYLMSPVKRKPWLHVNRLFLAMGIAHDDSVARREFERQLEARRLIEKSSDWNKVRRGWFLGGEDFRALLITRIRDQLKEGHYAEQKQESIRAHAERIVIDELRRHNWNEMDLLHQLKGDKVKVAIARRVRSETTATLKWISSRLKMGKWSYAANCIYELAKKDERKKPKQTTVTSNSATEIASKSSISQKQVRTDPFLFEVLPTHCL